MSYTESPELIASRLRSEISCSESKTSSLVRDAERRLGERIHELEMKLISSGAFHRRDWPADWLMLAPAVFMFMFVLMLCLTGHSRESANTEPVSQPARAEISTPHTAPTPEEGK